MLNLQTKAQEMFPKKVSEYIFFFLQLTVAILKVTFSSSLACFRHLSKSHVSVKRKRKNSKLTFTLLFPRFSSIACAL